MVIGGFAVSAHNYSRATNDIDLMGKKGDRSKWNELLQVRKYSAIEQPEAFAQWAPPLGSSFMNLDIMFVNEQTFSQMWADSRETLIAGLPVRVTSLDHLIALKLHALRHGGKHRVFKDMSDVVYLIDINQIDVRSEHFRNLCLKYGTQEIYERLRGSSNT